MKGLETEGSEWRGDGQEEVKEEEEEVQRC